MALATVEDFATFLQRDLSAQDTASATLLLDLVSAAIRSYTGQTISAATTTERLRPRNGKLRPSQRPITAVTAVTTTDTVPVAVDHEWDGAGSIYLTTLDGVWTDWSHSYRPASYLVTYTHGYATVPDDIRAITLQVAGRSFGATADTTGTQSESIGGYSYSMGAAAAQGAVGFLAGERAVLDRYKLPAGPIVMERV